MSLSSWKAEFYPVDACTVSKEFALEHSLKKWIGLRPENLARHEVVLKGTFVTCPVEGSSLKLGWTRLILGGSSCALCIHYADSAPVYSNCKSCPLAKITGTDCEHQWMIATYPAEGELADVEPMIKLIEDAIFNSQTETVETGEQE